MTKQIHQFGFVAARDQLVVELNYLCLAAPCRPANAAAVILVEFINGDQPLLQRLGVGNRHRGDAPVWKQEFRAFRVR